MDFLPISIEDMNKRGWAQCDFVFVTGDAYVDHSSFATGIISRLLERYSYKVGIIAQPDWKDINSFKKLGEPRLGFLVNSGNIDSMVNHYTSFKKKRSTDAYSPGGKSGLRPDRAVTVYSNRIREAYKHVPIIIGGIEASLRRLSHYDYWSDSMKRSVLMDSGADLLVYGMGEKSILQIAEALEAGIPVNEITFINGTVYKTKDKDRPFDPIFLPSYEETASSKQKFGKSFKIQYENTDSKTGRTLVEQYDTVYVVQNPPMDPLTMQELDDIYDLNYMMDCHPIYKKSGGVPALKEIKFSITSVRGCFGGCSFCALNFHQGRVVQGRSHDSILKEVDKILNDKEFKGYIHDVGGPTANFRIRACKKQSKYGVCKDRECLSPEKCKNLRVDHSDYLELLRKIRNVKGIKKVFIRSGIRYDYAIYDNNDEFIKELCKYHVSGQLRTAPEHVSESVLKLMGKPSINIYNKFVRKFYAESKKINKEQYIVPYFISSHPGSHLKDAIELAEYIRDMGYIPEQVQDFYPTPGTLSTCMYYTGFNPLTGESIYVPKEREDKRMQRALMQYSKRENYNLVLKALQKENRHDLIGYGPKCLIKPRKPV
ncbi:MULTISPECIES: YgiQ family radical SAM protein [unclassified Sedimentibacter]|uniref:YgiQ family radical SAM protein n=1 Tax=unclassified Sedimentibacter TaxID=2649220 RepID=UPI0027DF4039|nr:YgiQ family radical SAM protein [Sedimentibacter sp. MB35-C1]WMJ76401.1 YgiQ family radical SAM protein [Sedimentibacter sp. MB35-C1]